MDRRVIYAIQRTYPQGIPFQEIERALLMVESFSIALNSSPAPAPKAITAPRPAPVAKVKRGPGRPPKARAAAVVPSAPVQSEGDLSNAERAREALRRGPMTAPELQRELGLGEGATHPLLARIGAKPIGEVELEDGSTLKQYGLQQN